MITTAQILAYIESGKTFSLKVISYNRKQKSGGEEIHYPEARLAKKQSANHARPKTKVEELQALLAAGKRKDPKHRKWYTRNIQVLQDGFPLPMVRSIHPPLIVEFNGDKEVVP